jgi:ATP-dependent Clp protease ATP-binding subunit ClpX
MGNTPAILVNLEGLDNEKIKNTLYRKITPFVNGTNAHLIAYTEEIECHVDQESSLVYSVMINDTDKGTQQVNKINKDDLLDYLCVQLCRRDESEATGAASPKKKEKIIDCGTPMDIRKSLDEYIISQSGAKKTLSVAAYNHALRVNMEDNTNIYKANILLIGPTGTGKTATVRALAEHTLHVPYATISATTLSATGYAGGDVSDALTLLVNQTKKFTKDGKISVPLAESGIIFIDEIDKIRFHGYGNSSGQDINGESVQQALLSMVEGNNYDIHPDGRFGPTVTINTKNILFIVGGAFSGLGKVIRDRIYNEQLEASQQLPGQTTMFVDEDRIDYFDIDLTTASDDDLLKYVTDADIEKFGFIPEFIGRFPNVSILNPLTTEDYLNILTEPKDSLVYQFTAIFAESRAEVEFSDTLLRYVAKECTKRNRGARGLRSIMEELLRDTMYIAPSLAQYEPKISFSMDEKDRPCVSFTIKSASADEIQPTFDACEFENTTVKLVAG